MFVSVTRLRVRRFIDLPVFLWKTQLAKRQVMRVPGFLGGKLLVDAHRVYWTLTVWESDRAMRAYRGSGTHSSVMPRLVEWCDEAAYMHWEVVSNSIPEWTEAYERLQREGRLSRVETPSTDHEAKRFPPPRLQPLIGQILKPTA